MNSLFMRIRGDLCKKQLLQLVNIALLWLILVNFGRNRALVYKI